MAQNAQAMRLMLFFLLFPILLSAQNLLKGPQAPAPPDTIYGTGFRVHDGDSFYLRTDTSEFPVRISGIDAPERPNPWMKAAQPYWKESRAGLNTLVYQKPVKVVIKQMDAYGRMLCDVYVGTVNVGLTQATNGNAWHYSNSTNTTDIQRAAARAKKAKIGLWASTVEPIDPFKWRRTYTTGSTAK